MTVVLDIETENQNLLIDFLKSLNFVKSIQVLDFSLQETEANDLAHFANESFATIWEGEQNEHWDAFILNAPAHV